MSEEEIETDFDKAIRELREIRKADRKKKESKIVWGRCEDAFKDKEVRKQNYYLRV